MIHVRAAAEKNIKNAVERHNKFSKAPGWGAFLVDKDCYYIITNVYLLT